MSTHVAVDAWPDGWPTDLTFDRDDGTIGAYRNGTVTVLSVTDSSFALAYDGGEICSVESVDQQWVLGEDCAPGR